MTDEEWLDIVKDHPVLPYFANIATCEDWLDIVKDHPRVFHKVPKEWITPEICDVAVKKDHQLFVCVPDKFKTQTMCDVAVKKDHELFGHVPYKFKTQEMCDVALEQDSSNLEYVPYNLKTLEMCLDAVKKDPTKYYVLEYVPEEFKKTKEMFLLLVEHDSRLFERVPDEFKTQEMCDVAVFDYHWNIDLVPEKFITPEICVSAVERNGLTIKYVPEKLKTKELCTKALEQLNEFGREDLEEIERYKAEERFVCRLRLGVLDLENLEELNTFFSHVPVKLRDSEMYLSFFKLCHNIGYVQGFLEGQTYGKKNINKGENYDG